MKRALAIALAACVVALPAAAQTKKKPLTGNLVEDVKSLTSTASSAATPPSNGINSALTQVLQALSKPFQQIANVIGTDLDDAVALSTKIPSLQDGNGQACWKGFQEFGAVVKIHPLPLTGHLATDLEAARLMTISANKLCLNMQCNQVFTELAAAAQKASLAPGIAVPSLSAICTQIPTVAVVAPTAESAGSTAAPATSTPGTAPSSNSATTNAPVVVPTAPAAAPTTTPAPATTAPPNP